MTSITKAPRITKAARLAIEQEQARVADVVFEETLHKRLMELFADITAEGLDLVVRKNKDNVLVFSVDNNERWSDSEFHFNMKRDEEWRLDMAEDWFSIERIRREQAARKAQKREAAMAKLTAEERELLGL